VKEKKKRRGESFEGGQMYVVGNEEGRTFSQ